MWQESEIDIGSVKQLLEDGYEIEVDSPDGYVPVNYFVDKGDWEEHILYMDDPELEPVRCNEKHLFETTNGWEYASDLAGKGKFEFITRKGLSKGHVVRTGKMIPIVDINVEHENHRYYTNGVSSHNTGVGKSLFMCHCASAALMMGKNVLYLTMEMSEERIAERIDANTMNVPIKDIPDMPKEMFGKKLFALRNKTQGKLIVKEYPTASAHVGHFRHLLQELELKRDWKPDIIFVDYLNICASARVKPGSGSNSYTLVKSIAEELRGLAVEFDVPLVSATQTTRSGYGSTDIGLEDTSESFGLPATADFMFALISSEELQELDQLVVKQLKNRYNDPSVYKRFVVGIDRSRMKLYDVEQEAQADLVDQVAPESNSNDRGAEKFNDFKF